MSLLRSVLWTSAGAALIAVSACASTGEVTQAQPALTAEQRAAKAEERAAIARADPLTQASYWTAEYDADPTSADNAIGFAKALRAIGSHERALDVLGKSLAIYPANTEMLLIAAKALASLERYPEAQATYQQVLAIKPDMVQAIAGLALVHDATGRHRLAQDYYRQALSLEPDRPNTMSNYAMSLVLSGNIEEAEALLRTALDMPGASPVVRQNLALVVGLQGRFEEMRTIGGADLPDALADANVDMIRAMLAPSRSWEAMADEGGAGEDGADPSPALRGSLPQAN